MASHEVLAKSAAARAHHMARALDWFGDQIQIPSQLSSTFVRLSERLCLACSDTFNLHAGGRQVHFVAVGKSGGVAQVLVSMLSSVGINARFLHPTEAFHGDFGSVWEKDTVVCLSNNGRSAELLQVIPKLKERHCEIYALTSKEISPLAQACDYFLAMPTVEEFCPLNQAPLTSTVATLAVGQLLVAATMEIRAFNLEKYARNHPGGAIGKRIFVRVEEIMAQGKGLPTLSENTSFKECVSIFTEFSFGAVLVVRNKELAGLISEKDLRAAMERWGPSVFSKSATDLMNSKPIVVQKGTLAVEALRLMENRQRPLNVLPVIDENFEAVGLLRLHDLVAEGISLL